MSQPTVPQSSTGQGSNAVSTPGPYVPPHHYQNHVGRNGDVADCRFSKDVLLDLYRTQKDAGDLGKNLTDLLAGDWQPGGGVNAPSSSIWSRKDEPSKDGPAAADICWDANGSVVPLGLLDMTDAEKEVARPSCCSGSIRRTTEADGSRSSSLPRSTRRSSRLRRVRARIRIRPAWA